MNRSAHLTSIHRYPIKGFRGQQLGEADLRPGAGISFDRVFAVANGERLVPQGGDWTACQAFVRLTRNADLYSYEVGYDDRASAATLRAPNGEVVSLQSSQHARQSRHGSLQDLFGEAAFVTSRSTDNAGYWDHEDAVLSLINLQTVRLLSEAAEQTLDPLRFRANLYIDDLAPGAEYALLGHRIQIGGQEGPILEILRPIDRCKATSIDPTTGDRTVNVPALLARTLGHVFCGVYARVVSTGRIREGDAIRTLGPAISAVHDGSKVATAPPVADWPRAARVLNTVEESGDVTSFWLDDPLHELRPPSRAGQHLRVHFTHAGGRATWRAYTISAAIDQQLRISVKRDGVASRYLHDALAADSELLITGPFGNIVLPPNDVSRSSTLTFFSAGIGITPTVAMLRELDEQRDTRRIHVHHVAKDERDLALWHEVLVAANRLPNALMQLHLTRASKEMCSRFNAAVGRPDWAALIAAIGSDTDVFLCGPDGLVDELRRLLTAAGVKQERVRSEAFISPQTLLDSPPIDAAAREAMWGDQRFAIRFKRSEINAEWTARSGSLLEVAEAAGLAPAANCRSGACGTCRAQVLSGSVIHDPSPALPLALDEALLCCAYPAPDGGELSIDI